MKAVLLLVALATLVCLTGTVIANSLTPQWLTAAEMMRVAGGGCHTCTDCADHTDSCASYPDTDGCSEADPEGGCNFQNKYLVYNLCRAGGSLDNDCDAAQDQTCYYYHDCYCHHSSSGWECASPIDGEPYNYEHSDDPCD